MKKYVLSLILALAVILGLVSSISATSKKEVELWHWSQEQIDYYEEMIEKFEAENPDIDIKFQTYVLDQYRTSLPLALRGNSGPDIFYLPPEEDPYKFINNGWIQPIGDYISEDFLEMFDQRQFVEGIMYFNGELYTLPFFNPYVRLNGMMFYNKDILRKAGFDPDTSLPKTYSEFRTLLRKITEAGKGQYYGIGWSAKPANELHRILVGLLGEGTVASSDARFGKPGFDYRDGKFKASDEEHQEVFNLLKGIVDDGSIIPGWSSMDKGTVRALFAQGKIAFYFDGEWMKGVWNSMGYTDFVYGENYGIALETPLPDSGRKAYRGMNLTHGTVFVSAFAEDIEATMRVYRWLHDVEMQSGFMENDFFIPGNLKVDTSKLNQYRKDILKMANEYTIPAPQPTIKNKDVSAVIWPSIHPDIYEIMAGALLGEMDYVEEAKAWDEKMQVALERNIKKAQEEGYNVSIDDFIFPDWDPLKKD